MHGLSSLRLAYYFPFLSNIIPVLFSLSPTKCFSPSFPLLHCYIFVFSDCNHLSLSHASCISLPSIICLPAPLSQAGKLLCLSSRVITPRSLGLERHSSKQGAYHQSQEPRDVHTQTLPQILLKTLLSHSHTAFYSNRTNIQIEKLINYFDIIFFANQFI